MEQKTIDLARQIVQNLKLSNLKVTVAESCTGGLISAYLTEIDGASQIFECGFVTYSNEAKSRFLFVKEDTIQKYGAVSSQTVSELTKGALKASKANIALSVSGIAGPTGGSPEKPVGLVWFALQIEDRVESVSRIFEGDRHQVRESAASFGLSLIQKSL